MTPYLKKLSSVCVGAGAINYGNEPRITRKTKFLEVGSVAGVNPNLETTCLGVGKDSRVFRGKWV